MGQAVAVLAELGRCDPCSSCAKYCLNEMYCHSSCMQDCCDVEIQTAATEVSREEIDASVGCCELHKSS